MHSCSNVDTSSFKKGFNNKYISFQHPFAWEYLENDNEFVVAKLFDKKYQSVITISVAPCITNDIEEIKEILPKLLPFAIGKDGRLLEWYKEEQEEEIKHRHVSHLYGLFPANLIDVDRNPELVDAAKKTLKKRGDGGTGWSLGWKINFFSRLRDGNHALKLLNNQLRYIPDPETRGRGGTYPNMLDAHPPFQIDGNFGAVSGMAQMFLQSFGNRNLILPALPDEWKNGSVKGLLAKGGVTVDIEWKDGRLSKLTACGEGEFEFVYGDKSITVTLDGTKKEIGEIV